MRPANSTHPSHVSLLASFTRIVTVFFVIVNVIVKDNDEYGTMDSEAAGEHYYPSVRLDVQSPLIV